MIRVASSGEIMLNPVLLAGIVLGFFILLLMLRLLRGLLTPSWPPPLMVPAPVEPESGSGLGCLFMLVLIGLGSMVLMINR